MGFEASLTLAVIAAAIVGLALELASHEVIMASAITLLMAFGVIAPDAALAGFGSTAVLTIGALLVVAAGVRRTGFLTTMAESLFGGDQSREPLFKMMVPAAALSAFLNNTPIVAMFAPAIIDWCKRRDLAPSRMLMPLSFATILGGLTTLIGTSTTLVVDGLMRARQMKPMGMFEIAAVGLPVAVVGITVIWLLARWVLPDRRDPVRRLDEAQREFLVEMLVDPGSPLVGQSIAEAGLRNLPGLFLMNIQRAEHYLGAIGPAEVLSADDRLIFTGVASTVVDLRRFPGLSPAPEAHYDPTAAERRSHVFETVVSLRSPLVGRTIKDVGFRSRYDAAVIAVHHAGELLAQKIGDVELRAGDTLMIEADEQFLGRWADSADFSLVARTQAEPAPQRRKAPWALLVVAGLVVVVTLEWLPIVVAAFGAAAIMILSGLISARDASKAVDLPILITIACAMGLGAALEQSGAAEQLAGILTAAGAWLGPLGILAATFLLASILNAVITNVAAAAVVFPIAIAAAEQAHLDPRPFAFTVAIAATCSFLTPTAYQTNLMVYGPGGYRFTDFARLGLPLLAVIFVVTLLVIPRVWPL